MLKNTKKHTENFQTSGTILAASAYSIQKILKNIAFNKVQTIVELGLGDGCITKEILAKTGTDSKVYGFEINPKFITLCSKIKDNRLELIDDSAETMTIKLRERNIYQVDVIVSTLPLSMIAKLTVKSILEQASHLIADNGIFIQAVHNPFLYFKLRKYFNVVDTQCELRNFPPYIFFTCRKKGSN